MQDIENSIAFCKLQVLHPSIMKPFDLFVELKEIEHYYKNQFPFDLKFENILELENAIKVNCKVEKDKIIYFLSIPINFEEEFSLYHLLPIPTMIKSEYATIFNDIKYILKSKDNKIKSLKGICAKAKYFQCSNQLITNHHATCEEALLTLGNTSSCKYTKLQIPKNHLEMIIEINQYLAVFPKTDEIKLICQKETQTKLLKGIYLINQKNCKLFYHGEEILYQTKSYGKPAIIENFELKLKEQQISNFTIKMKTLNHEGVSWNPVVPVMHITEDNKKFYIPSLWTTLLYCSILIILILYCLKLFRTKIARNAAEIQQSDDQGNPIRLPAEASF